MAAPVGRGNDLSKRERILDKLISRGSVDAVFSLQCLVAIDCTTLCSD